MNIKIALLPLTDFYILLPILVFDARFISENIFDGERIFDSHKTNLHRVIVGEKGVALAGKVKITEEKITKNEADGRLKTSVYNLTDFRNNFSIEEFIKLIPVIDIDTQIKEKESELKFAKQLEKPSEIVFPMPNFTNLRLILQKNLKSNHAAAEERINQHIKECWKKDAKDTEFLEKGRSLLQGDEVGKQTCPFCGQNLSAVGDLIEAYQAYFDEEYEKLLNNVKDLSNKFKKWYIDNALSNLLLSAKGWESYLKEGDYADFKQIIEDKKTKAIVAKEAFEKEIEAKQKDLNYTPDFETLKEVEGIWIEFAGAVKNYNEKIASFVSQNKKSDVKSLSNALRKLQIIKSRFEAKWVQWCKDFQQLQKDNNGLKKDRDDSIKQLSAYSKAVFDKNQEKVNEVLKKIGADFKVKNFSEHNDFRRSESVFCGFELEFFEQHIVQVEGLDEEQTFRNTLSLADKNSLAFAFFISLLSHDVELKDKIIIVDDPVSSYDDERRLITAQMLAEIKNSRNEEPAQKIILTHSSDFLIKLYQEQKFSTAKFIKITKDGVENRVKKSKFEECDVFVEFIKPKEILYLEKIHDLLANDGIIPENAHGDFRKVFEAAFKSKYSIELREEISARKSIQSFTQRLFDLNIYTEEKMQRLNSLFCRLQPPHHDSIEVKVAGDTQGDLKTILQECLEILREV